jgi:hypothetical protein
MLQITHACGYEHPSQLTMRDVDMGMGDNAATVPLEQTFGYKKVPVPFDGMSAMLNCPYLGGKQHPIVSGSK